MSNHICLVNFINRLMETSSKLTQILPHIQTYTQFLKGEIGVKSFKLQKFADMPVERKSKYIILNLANEFKIRGGLPE